MVTADEFRAMRWSYGHGRHRGHNSRRRRPRAARLQPGPGDLPEDRAHRPRSPSSTSSSTTWPSRTGSCERSGGGRPRWSAGRRASTPASCSPLGRGAVAMPSSRSASRRARPSTSRPRGSSSRRGATPTRSARPRSRSSAGAPRWGRSRSIRGRSAREDVDHPDELRIDLDPQPGTDYPDAVRVAGEAHALLDELGYAGFPKTSGGRGIHIYVRIEPRWTFTDVRHAAIAFGRELERRLPGEVTTKWWKEERGERIFVDYNQNARDRTIASAYSIRPKPGAPVSAPADVGRGRRRRARGLHGRDDARPLRRGGRPPRRDRRRRALAPAPARHVRARRGRGRGDMPYPPDYPKMPGEPKRVQPSRDRDRKKD